MRWRWRSPATVSIVLAVLGITGAVAVFVAGHSIRDDDRADYATWRRDALPFVEAARAASARLPPLAEQLAPGAARRVPASVRTGLTDVRQELQRARDAMLKVPIPGILGPTNAAYFEAIARSLDAVSALQDIVNQPRAPRVEAHARYTSASALATQAFDDGEEALATLAARLTG